MIKGVASGKQSTHEHYAMNAFRGTKYKCLENFALYGIIIHAHHSMNACADSAFWSEHCDIKMWVYELQDDL